MAWYLFFMEKRVLQMAKRFHLRTRSFFMFFSCDFFLECFWKSWAAEARCEWESKCLGRDLCRWLISTTYNVFRSLLGCFSPHSNLPQVQGNISQRFHTLASKMGMTFAFFVMTTSQQVTRTPHFTQAVTKGCDTWQNTWRMFVALHFRATVIFLHHLADCLILRTQRQHRLHNETRGDCY